MSDLSKYTGRFRISGAGLQGSLSGKSTKRPRESLVCNQCRVAKLRCDKAKPCGSCVKRGGGTSCSYKKRPVADSSGRSVAEDRLDRLESMVTRLMQSQAPQQAVQEGPVTPPDLPEDPSAADYRNPKHNAEKYPTVLEDIMSSIHDLKMALPAVNEDLESNSSAEQNENGTEPIFGSSSTYSLTQILNRHLPSRAEADRLVTVYFQGDTFIQPFIHAAQLQIQYEQFWSDTSAVSPIWLSILFSMFHMSSRTRTALSFPLTVDIGAEEDPDYHKAAGECLVLGQYHRAQRYVPEALIFYAHSVGLTSLDPSRESGAIMSMAVRVAYQMGYHRDPDVFGTFSVFEGEMRRRFWAVCKQVDTMIAFQLGLPANIRFENCDTRSPRNLLDTDFGPASTSLPPSRPESEMTGMLWFIVKDRLMPSFSTVCQAALSLKPVSEQHVQALDDEIRLVHSTIPDTLRARPISESRLDFPGLIMVRLYLEFFHLKSFCILHRKHMMLGSLYSTRNCVDAGLKIVRTALDAYKEFSPGGQLFEVRWMFNNYYLSDFHLGVVVLCLYVNICRQKKFGEELPETGPGSEIFMLLKQAHAVCVDMTPRSKDARKVSLAIRLALAGVATMRTHEKLMATRPEDVNQTTLETQASTTEDGAQRDLNWFPPHSISGQADMQELSFEALDPFNFMSTEPVDFESIIANADSMTWDQNMLPLQA